MRRLSLVKMEDGTMEKLKCRRHKGKCDVIEAIGVQFYQAKSQCHSHKDGGEVV